MRRTAGVVRRVLPLPGLLCVLAAFALLPTGVRIVRAEEGRVADRVEASPVSDRLEADSARSDRSGPPAPRAVPAAASPVGPNAAHRPAPASGTPPSGPLAEAEASPVAPFVRAEDVENARRPGVSGIETAPGIVVLNTRGYNYGPPPTPLEPEALQHESPSR